MVEPGVRTGMPILYEPPGDVGADRIVNGVAALAAFGGPVIVVDFGTATTFDVVTRKGEYVGGVICPGVGISADALFQRAARLPRVDVRNPGRVIGRSTVGSIQAGLYFGYAAMVRGHHRPHPRRARRAGAGGGHRRAGRVAGPRHPAIEAVDPVLTLTGLRLIWERNRPDRPEAREWATIPRPSTSRPSRSSSSRRRGDPLFLSNADWLLIRKWRRAGMPLRVVLRGIARRPRLARAFLRARPQGGEPGVLRGRGGRGRRALAARPGGRRAGGRRRAPSARWPALAGRPRLPARPRAGRARKIAAEMREREQSTRAPSSRAALAAAETQLLARARDATLATRSVARVEAEVERGAAPLSGPRMPAKVLAQMREESRARRLLEAHGLPRLSLFHRRERRMPVRPDGDALRVGELEVRIEKARLPRSGPGSARGPRGVRAPRASRRPRCACGSTSLERGFARAAAEGCWSQVRGRRAARPVRTPQRCGGCAYQELDYRAQLDVKRGGPGESLQRAGVPLGGADRRAASAEDGLAYARLASTSTRARAALRLGLHEEGTPSRGGPRALPAALARR